MRSENNISAHIVQEWKRSDKERTVASVGTSMHPLIREGDSITFIKTDSIRSGDIVVYEKRHAGLVAHRIIGREKSTAGIMLLEKGDNRYNAVCLAPDTILGTVIRIARGSTVIDLSSRKWRLLNRCTGVYLLGIHRLRQFLVFMKNALGLGGVRAPASIKRILQQLQRLPSRLFKNI